MEVHDLASIQARKRTQPIVRTKTLTTNELITFSKSLQALLTGGVPITRALEGLRKEAKPASSLRQVIEMISSDIQRGSSLSESLEKSGMVPAFFCQSIYAGEISGRVPEVLAELVKYSEREQALKRTAKEAVVYPAFIIMVGFITLGVLACYVLPKLRTVYDEFGTTLPLITRIILGASDAFLPMVCILVIGAFALSFVFKQNNLMATLFYEAPLIGDFWKGFLRVRLTRLLSLLLESGIPALESLTVVEKTFENHFLSGDLRVLKESIASGRGFSDCLEQATWMNGLSRMLVVSGEETGRLGASFGQIARDTEAALESQIQLAMKLIEPGFVLVIGLVVGFVVIGTVLPIFDMSGIVQ